ncbi:MAG TPA: phosphate acetyltransferase [Candidatus Sumerlaeota bacterium]|nr:phosphate acetyltransferase [Candidatus Sumerlaeota bacterium]HRR31963.1 phosphate acetyltransferase [Candidatus Sumerlaeia bacterium]HON50933.1 phosphate acetyltransferase [Candidatus Sumerlaeota bacterium]HOR65627.1 phosphate acetyltransferase [Candidatus Sumerlaeota bacterium]HPL74636.1 phosphate acetyltransferase [Candidatus Sumerlaeota bacterium]
MGIMDKIIERAKSNKQKIVLPESFYEARTVKAGAIIQREGIADVTLLGDPEKVKDLVKDVGISLDGVAILDHEKSDLLESFAETYREIRVKENLTKDQAIAQMKDPLYFGTMMVKKGIMGGMTCGAYNTTANVMRAAIKIIGSQKGIKTVSSCFLMIVPDCPYGADGAMIYADCGTVPNPNEEQLADIAIAAAGMCKMLLGVEPYVAMLSFSTYGSAKDPLVDKVINATKIAKAKAPELNIDGELQGDSALIASIGQKKCPGSPVAGKANTLIFPDLNAGNIAYKLTQRLAKAEAYGPLVQGLALPVNDLSRGCSTEDIVQVSAVTAIEAQAMKK